MTRSRRKEFEELTREWEKHIRNAFLEALADMGDLQMDLLEAAIRREDYAEVVALTNLRPETFAGLQARIDQAFYAGGVTALSSLPKRSLKASSGRRLVVRFQGRHLRAEAWTRDRGGRLITEISDGLREAITEKVRAGLRDGQNPRKIALELAGRKAGQRRQGGLIGLHSRYAQAVDRAREELADPDQMAKYFRRSLRNRNFDSLVRKAQRDGKALAAADIDRVAGAYADRLLYRRAEDIARTEALTALTAGQMEGTEQLIESGAVKRSAVKIRWRSSRDERTRADHIAMHGATVQFGQAFVLPDGSRMKHPRDHSLGASAAQLVNCRCYAETDIDFLAA